MLADAVDVLRVCSGWYHHVCHDLLRRQQHEGRDRLYIHAALLRHRKLLLSIAMKLHNLKL